MHSSSFVHRSSQSPASQPVTSRKGGYLRSPFDVDFGSLPIPLLSKQSNQQASAGSRAQQVAASLDAARTSRVRSREEAEGMGGNDVERPWHRAGVGASRLSMKEKQRQQAEAREVYDPTSAPDAAAPTSSSKQPSASGGEASTAMPTVPRTLEDNKLFKHVVSSEAKKKRLKEAKQFTPSSTLNVAATQEQPFSSSSPAHQQQVASQSTLPSTTERAETLPQKALTTAAAPMDRRKALESKRLEALYGNKSKNNRRR